MLKTAFVSSFFWASLGAIWMKVGGHHPETSWTFLSAAEPQMLSRKPQKAQTNKSPYTALSIPSLRGQQCYVKTTLDNFNNTAWPHVVRFEPT